MNKDVLLLALAWYEERAVSIQRYASQNPPNTMGMVAVMKELELDGGFRAREARKK